VPGAARHRADHPDAALGIAFEHGRRGVAEAVAVARLHHRRARRHGIEEACRRRGLAAVVRHEQHVRAQRRGVAHDERRLLLALDVPSQQRARVRVAHAQDA
jgi:hypothetical protein